MTGVPALLALIALSGCLPAQPNQPVQTAPVTPTITATFPGLTPTPTLPATETPTPSLPATETPAPTSTREPATLELGQPFWIGRGKMRGAAFLPGARQVAIAWGSGVSLNAVATGQEVWFQPTTSNLIAFDVEPNGQALAAALTDGSVVVFDATDGTPRRFEGAKPNASWGDIAWSPDGRTIAFQFIGANRSDPIYLLDVASGQIGQVPDSQTGEGVGPELAWSPDGASITVRALGNACSRFIDIHTGELRMALGTPGKCYSIDSLLFLPDGQMAVVNSQADGLDLVRFPGGEPTRSFKGTAEVLGGGLIEFPATSGALFTDPGGQWIAVRGGFEPCYCGNPEDHPEHPLIVWDLAGGIEQARLDQVLEPLVYRHRLAAAFDGQDIVMLYESGEITRWAFGDPQAEERVSARVPVRPVSAMTLTWSFDGSRLAFEGRYGGVDVYALESQQLVRRFDPPLASPALSPDGSLVALFDPDQNVEALYQADSGQLLLSLPATPVLMGAAFSPDGLYLAYGNGAQVLVAEVASGQVTTLEARGAAPVSADMTASRLIWSPDGQALATVFGAASGGDVGAGVIMLWKRLEDGSFEALYHVSNVQANYTLPNQVLAIFNPSGSRVAMQSMPTLEAGQTRLVVYDLETGKVVQSLLNYKPGAWVNDEELLAAEVQYGCQLTRINVLSGEMTVGGFDNGGLAYAPGGIFTAQMSIPPERGVSVRNWRSRAVIAQGTYEALNLIDTRWSPDGRWLASIGDDGTLRVWPVRIPEN